MLSRPGFTTAETSGINKDNLLTVTRAGVDAYGNADPHATSSITVDLASTDGTWSSTTVTIAANATLGGTSTYRTPFDDKVPYTITGHTATAGYSDASCSGTTTNS